MPVAAIGVVIWDTFIFNDEVELLEIRLYELDPVVNFFVVCESPHTFTGKPKPLMFDKNASMFRKYDIIHKIVELPHTNHPTPDQVWENENFQRNALGRLAAKPSDIVLISDVDEIPRREALGILGKRPTKFHQPVYYYYLNMAARGQVSSPFGTTPTDKESLDRFMPQYLRQLCYSPYGDVIWDAGWHFSYLGGPERIAKKLVSFSHTEYSSQNFTDLKHIEDAVAEGKDLFGRAQTFEVIPVDDSFPHAVRDDPVSFKSLIRAS